MLEPHERGAASARTHAPSVEEQSSNQPDTKPRGSVLQGRYPHEPGVRANSTGETAREAAEVVRKLAKSLEQRCIELLAEGPLTPDEAHARLEAELGRRLNIYSVRPRFSALRAQGLAVDSGERRAPAGGCRAIVWRQPTPEERASWFEARRPVQSSGASR